MSKPMRVVREYVQRGHVEKNIGTTPIAAKKMRVAAYCRVSTKEDDQLNSYEAQINYYTRYISSKPEWDFVGIYADEVTGTRLRRLKSLRKKSLSGTKASIEQKPFFPLRNQEKKKPKEEATQTKGKVIVGAKKGM